MVRVKEPDDPRRCMGAAPDGQCWNRAEEGSEYCLAHGGKSTAEDESKRLYLLAEAKHRTRLAQLSEHEEIKSLREEIALARMLIERRLDLVKSDSDLLSAVGPINTLLLTVERLVKSCNTLEQNLGALLSKPTVLKLGQQLCQIIVEELDGIDDYEPIVDRITDRVIATIADAKNLDDSA